MNARKAAVVVAVTALVVVSASPTVRADGDPPLTADAEALQMALACNNPPGEDHEPVLLVHGTGTTAPENWGWGFRRALVALGIDTCWVTLPDRAMGDIQHSTEYVVHAVHWMHEHFGRAVDIVGHSQGGLQPRWALRWWPSLHAMVDDVVTLGSPHHGTLVVDVACAWRCPPAVHQMRPGSNFLSALNRGDETPGDVDYTSVASQFDLVVQPTATAWLAGASNVLIQDVCAARPVDHVGLIGDAVTFAVALDALTQPGPADPERVDAVHCSGGTYDGFDAVGGVGMAAPSFFDPDSWGEWEYTDEEPALEPYAQTD